MAVRGVETSAKCQGNWRHWWKLVWAWSYRPAKPHTTHTLCSRWLGSCHQPVRQYMADGTPKWQVDKLSKVFNKTTCIKPSYYSVFRILRITDHCLICTIQAVSEEILINGIYCTSMINLWINWIFASAITLKIGLVGPFHGLLDSVAHSLLFFWFVKCERYAQCWATALVFRW